MTLNERQRKGLAVGALAEMFGRRLTDAALDMYVAALEGIPAEAIERAAQEMASTGDAFPPPARLREAAGDARPADRATLAFAALERAIGEVGYYKSPNFDDPLINATVRMLGGWERVCEMPGEEFDKWYRKEFERTYQTLSRTGVGDEAAAPLVGFHERTNLVGGHEVRSRETVATGLPWAGEQVKQLPAPKRRPADLPRLEFKRA